MFHQVISKGAVESFYSAINFHEIKYILLKSVRISNVSI